MKFLTDYLNKVSDAIKTINSDTNDDSVINDTLYFHMVKRHLFTGRRSIIDIRRHVGNLYKEKSHPLMADHIREKIVKTLSLHIGHQVDIAIQNLPQANKRSIKITQLQYLLNVPNPAIARILYENSVRNGIIFQHHDANFDIESFLKIISATQLSDLNDITNTKLKTKVLEQLIVDSICNILDAVYQELVLLGIAKTNKELMSIESYIRLINLCCMNNILDATTIETKNESAKKDLISHCPKYPANGSTLIDFLNKLREQLSIFPSTCDKKTFGTIVYILFKGQKSIGLREEAYSTYSKFKQVLTQYYGMPDSKFKPKNVEQETINKLKRYPIFNQVKDDPKWK